MPEAARRSLLSGLSLVAGLALIALITGRSDAADLLRITLRALHVASAMLWVGLIWFVNAIQVPLMMQVAPDVATTLASALVARVALHMRVAANLTALSGLVMLATLGYLDQRPLAHSALLWAGVAGGLAMLAVLHAKVAPALRLLRDPSATPDAKAAARATAAMFARVNLALAVPVTFAMVGAAHG